MRTWMRRLYECRLKEGSIPWKAYGKEYISERHRHRFEINPMYVQRLAQAGLVPGIYPPGAY